MLVPALSSEFLQEFDTPLSLYNHDDSIFRGLCQKSNITEKDIN